MCASMGGAHHHKLVKHCVIATKSQSFVLQQMKCGLLDSDNPAKGPWRKVLQPPLWACHSLTHSFTHSLPHSLIFSCTAAASIAKQQHCPLLVNDQLTWTATSHLKPKCHIFLMLALSIPLWAFSGRPFSLWSTWRNAGFCSLGGPASTLSPTEQLPVRAC